MLQDGLIEDAAEALGSFWKGKTFRIIEAGVLSFNGNKPITCEQEEQ